jgi:host factor-I protein
MSLSANLEFVYLHNARLRHVELVIIMQGKQRYTSEILDFDQYSMIIKDNNHKININKKDILYLSSNTNIVDIEYISKTYYQAQSELKIRYQKPPIQDIFLNESRKYKFSTEILLKDGASVSGIILGFDSFIIIISKDNGQTMIYKNSLVYVHPLNQEFEIIRYAGESK